MHEPADHDLLRQFAEQHSETAFAALVARHVDKVYATALRHTRNVHAAEEITQAVFVILAKQSGRLGAKVILAGWLYETARLTAVTYLRSEIRRTRREQEAHMQSALNESADDVWPHLAPLLDDAMSKLSAAERHAVVLRYFDGKSLGEVGAALGASEDAAKKRVSRAVEKLRGWFTKRGVTLSATVLTAAIAANSVQAAPAGLAATVTAAAVKGTLISATLTTLVKTTMKTMTWLKINFAAGVGVAALLAGGVATVAISQTSSGEKLSGEVIFQKSRDAYAALTSYSDEGKTVASLNGTTVTHTFTIKLARPNFYRIAWEQSSESAAYKSATTKSAVWSAGAGDYLDMGFGGASKQKDKEMALGGATGISGGAAATIPGTFFKMGLGNQLGGFQAKKERLVDEKVGDADCYVLTSGSKDHANTIWIGKSDFLIHQVRKVTSAAAMKAMMEENLKRHPEIAARIPKMEYSDSVSTETHENIVVNQKFSPSDFAR